MTGPSFASIAYVAKHDDAAGGTIAVLRDGRTIGNIRKHPGGDSFVYFDGASNETTWMLEESNVAALKERIEARLLP